MSKVTLGSHVGYTEVRNYQSLSYADYKVGVTYDLNGYALGANVIGTEGAGANFRAFNTVTTTGKGDVKKLFDTAIVLSIGKTF